MITPTSPEREAAFFLENETQFQLGAMLTEQSHPKTRGLSEVIAKSTEQGLSMLLSVDDDIAPVARKTIESFAFEQLRRSILSTLQSGHRIFFSGCGATGRLAILLDAAHKKFCQTSKTLCGEDDVLFEKLAEQTVAIMTGGDFALIRSVESFEDYIAFGYRQMLDAGLRSGDCLIAISEGGETSSVIGTIHAALQTGAKVHFVFNNPNDVLVRNVERSRNVIENPAVNIVNLATGPMAVAGSTRMQATTIEMLIIGIAFETALTEHLKSLLSSKRFDALLLEESTPSHAIEDFERLLQQVRSETNLATLASLTEFEYSIYARNGLVTYFPCDYMIDIFTDTTERSPTFKIPPFRSIHETNLPLPWAFVKDPLRKTHDAWKNLLGREPRCIAWTPGDYQMMNARKTIISNPPRIGEDVLNTFLIGNEQDESRTSVIPNVAMAFLVGTESRHLDHPTEWRRAFVSLAQPFAFRAATVIGPSRPSETFLSNDDSLFFINIDLPVTPLDLFSHLAAKIVLNNISTATMAKLGRVCGNWMAHVDATNKKLIDRGIRLIVELAEIGYNEACFLLFHSIHEMESWTEARRKTVSPVAYTIEQIKQRKDH